MPSPHTRLCTKVQEISAHANVHAEPNAGQNGKRPEWLRTIGYGLVAAGIAVAALTAVWVAWHHPHSVTIPVPAPRPSVAQAVPHYAVTRTIRYSYTLRNDTSRVLIDVQFRTYAPVLQTSTQRCCKVLEASHPYRLEVDELGNQMLHFHFDILPPYSTQLIQVRAQLDIAETPNRIGLSDAGRFLQAERYVEISTSPIQDLARRVRAGTPLETVRNAYSWVAANLRYTGYHREDRGALYAVTEKAGDCTEYMYLFIALARANGIPARGVAGYVVAHDAVLRPGDPSGGNAVGAC